MIGFKLFMEEEDTESAEWIIKTLVMMIAGKLHWWRRQVSTLFVYYFSVHKKDDPYGVMTKMLRRHLKFFDTKKPISLVSGSQLQGRVGIKYVDAIHSSWGRDEIHAERTGGGIRGEVDTELPLDDFVKEYLQPNDEAIALSKKLYDYILYNEKWVGIQVNNFNKVLDELKNEIIATEPKFTEKFVDYINFLQTLKTIKFYIEWVENSWKKGEAIGLDTFLIEILNDYENEGKL